MNKKAMQKSATVQLFQIAEANKSEHLDLQMTKVNNKFKELEEQELKLRQELKLLHKIRQSKGGGGGCDRVSGKKTSTAVW